MLFISHLFTTHLAEFISLRAADLAPRSGNLSIRDFLPNLEHYHNSSPFTLYHNQTSTQNRELSIL